MEGPTPVSALLHAATMVTAGIFLIIRFSPLFEFSDNSLKFLLIFGFLTILFSSILGVYQYDIKKIIAYSTCSQLGYMFFMCGCSAYNYVLFHLFNHAFFKAGLFLLAGVLIYIFNGEQDIRKMFLGFMFPYYYFVSMILFLSLIGIPYFSGYFSKEYLGYIAQMYLIQICDNFLEFFCIAILFTVGYSIKILYFVFYKYFIFIIKIPVILKKYLFIPKFCINISLFILCLCSLLSGYLYYEFFCSRVSFLSCDLGNFIDLSIFNYDYFLLFISIINFLPIIIFFFSIFIFLFFEINMFYDLLFDSIVYKFFRMLKNDLLDYFFWFLIEISNFFIYDLYKCLFEKGFFEFFMSRGIIFFLKKF